MLISRPKLFLKYMADIKGVKKKEIVDNNGSKSYISVNEQIDKLLEIVNLTDAAYKRIGGFSRWNETKVAS